MWPAIWMLSTDWTYGGWPASGEIDIMENVGYDPYVIVASAHTQSYNHVQGTQKNATTTVSDCYTQFHNYILEWESSEYRVYVDDKLYFTFKNEGKGFPVWPFDKRFHLLLNVAVGGNWGGQKGIDDTIFLVRWWLIMSGFIKKNKIGDLNRGIHIMRLYQKSKFHKFNF